MISSDKIFFSIESNSNSDFPWGLDALVWRGQDICPLLDASSQTQGGYPKYVFNIIDIKSNDSPNSFLRVFTDSRKMC